MIARTGFGIFGLAMMLGLPSPALHAETTGALTVAQSAPTVQPKPAEAAPAEKSQDKVQDKSQDKSQDKVEEKAQDTVVDYSPEAIMNRRFPQKVKVGDLIGLPVLDDNDVTLGRVQRVVHTPEGKIRLIVGYSKWFGWFGRPVAVPIEVVAILARQIASLDMPPAEYDAAPTWTEGKDVPIPYSEIIHIAVTRR
jgi:PRC-barrel domain